MLANRIKVGALVALMLMAMELLAIAVIFRTPAAAHEAAPAVVTITPGSTGQAELSIATNLNDLLANLEGAGHDAFADLSQPDVQARLLADPNRL